MNLESLSLKELKIRAGECGIVGYHNFSKPKLIKLINEKLQLSSETVETEVAAVINSSEPEEVKSNFEEKAQNNKLSSQAIRWQDYLKKIGTTAEVFLLRYPNHKYKIFIEEVLSNERKEQSKAD